MDDGDLGSVETVGTMPPDLSHVLSSCSDAPKAQVNVRVIVYAWLSMLEESVGVKDDAHFCHDVHIQKAVHRQQRSYQLGTQS
eukprot:12609372-Ditylum_brightwellii.AAC.1